MREPSGCVYCLAVALLFWGLIGLTVFLAVRGLW